MAVIPTVSLETMINMTWLRIAKLTVSVLATVNTKRFVKQGHKVLTKIHFPFNLDVMKVHVLSNHSIEIRISVTSYYFSKSFEKK